MLNVLDPLRDSSLFPAPQELAGSRSALRAMIDDPEIVSMLQTIRGILGAEFIRVYAVTNAGTVRELLAEASSGLPADQVIFSLGALGAAKRGACAWVPSAKAAGAFHATLIETCAGQQLVLAARPVRSNALGRRALERKILPCASLVEWALSRWLKERTREVDSDAQLAILDLFGFALLLIDAECRILEANAAARAALAFSPVIAGRGDRFTISCIDTAMRFQVLLRHAAINPAETLIVAVSRDGELPLMLALRAVPDDVVHQGRVVVQIIDPGAGLSLPLESLSRHYGWTPVECRLVEQIVLGRTLAEAATVMRLKEQTARTYLKHIFQKTGLRRQVELVRLVLAGAIAKSGPSCTSANA